MLKSLPISIVRQMSSIFLGDPSKAKKELGWNPTKTSFDELVRLMVESDMKKVALEKHGEGFRFNLAEYLEKGIVK